MIQLRTVIQPTTKSTNIVSIYFFVYSTIMRFLSFFVLQTNRTTSKPTYGSTNEQRPASSYSTNTTGNDRSVNSGNDRYSSDRLTTASTGFQSSIHSRSSGNNAFSAGLAQLVASAKERPSTNNVSIRFRYDHFCKFVKWISQL